MGIAINQQRLVDRFMHIVQIDSPSSQERDMADFLLNEMRQLGFDVEEDNAGQKLRDEQGQHDELTSGGPAGNVIARKKGTQPDAAPVLFAAHMDTVVSNSGVNAQEQDGVIKTDGKSILGADDKAGVAALLEAAAVLQEQKYSHGPLEFVFTIAEESGLHGARLLDKTKLQAEYGFVMDSGGPPDEVIGSTPTEVDITVKIYGRAAHSGVNPEDGISAIAVAGLALTKFKIGKIDDKTSVNIGIIKGGDKTNIVCDLVEMYGEVRSRDQGALKDQLKLIRSACNAASEQFGARFEMEEKPIFSGFELTEEDPVVQLAFTGIKKAGMQPKLTSRGGGSDTNMFNAEGIPSVNLGVGAAKNHSNDENVAVEDLAAAAKTVLGIIEAVTEQRKPGGTS